MDKPWTVSVAPMPGEQCPPELERLDRSIRRGRGLRGSAGEALTERWRRFAYEPPKLAVRNLPDFLTVSRIFPELSFGEWCDWLIARNRMVL
jgi:hypothetical protein